MKVVSDFEIKHFVEFTKMYGGVLEVIHGDAEVYTAIYKDEAYKISPEALSQVKLLNQTLTVENRIMQ